MGIIFNAWKLWYHPEGNLSMIYEDPKDKRNFGTTENFGGFETRPKNVYVNYIIKAR